MKRETLNHQALEEYLAEQYQAETDLRQIQKSRASFEIFCLAMASLIGFLVGLAVQS